jgi:hypothetical protein
VIDVSWPVFTVHSGFSVVVVVSMIHNMFDGESMASDGSSSLSLFPISSNWIISLGYLSVLTGPPHQGRGHTI